MSAGHVTGQEARRELQASVVEPQQDREGLDELRLAEAGQALEQDVTAGRAGHEHEARELLLSEDRPIEALLDAKGLGARQVVARVHSPVYIESSILYETILGVDYILSVSETWNAKKADKLRLSIKPENLGRVTILE